MITMDAQRKNVKPTINPRDAWPAWTDEDFWETEESDAFEPTPEEQAQAARIFDEVAQRRSRLSGCHSVRIAPQAMPNNNLSDADVHPHGVC